jgi:hypothetical protein
MRQNFWHSIVQKIAFARTRRVNKTGSGPDVMAGLGVRVTVRFPAMAALGRSDCIAGSRRPPRDHRRCTAMTICLVGCSGA